MGDRSAKEGVEGSKRAELFRDGNYGIFIHWGLYSHLGGKWKGKTFYGISEWMKDQMKIPDDEYMGIAEEFNPDGFNAQEIVRVAKEAGMKWIIITSKHHKGFAMFQSKHPFNIVDATPFKRDPMKELAGALPRRRPRLRLLLFALPGLDRSRRRGWTDHPPGRVRRFV